MNKKSILVVDDDEIILDVIAEALSMFDFDVVTCNNPEKALEIFSKKYFHLILSDLSMEPINGIELAKNIIENYQKHPPIIIMTGFGNVESVIDAMKLGVKDYILKPFKIDYLIDVVNKTLKNSEIENENLKLKEIIDIYTASEELNNTLELDYVANALVKNLQNIIKADVICLYLNDEFNILKTKRDFFKVRKKYKYKEDEIYQFMPKKFHIKTIKNFYSEEHWKYCYFDKEIDIGIDLKYKSIVLYFLKVAQKDVGLVILVNFEESTQMIRNKLIPLKILFDEGAIAIENANLYKQNKEMFLKTLQSLAMTIDAKDAYTHYHSTNVTKYSKVIASKLNFSQDELEIISFGGLLHDIGKIGIPENILNKPDKLTDKEYEVIKQHPVIGKTILNPMRNQFPEIIDMIYYHHERFDGRGYPNGIGGDAIPLKARIISLADAFDAMTSNRSYREKLDLDIVINEIKKNLGTQFDPNIVDAFFDGLPEIKGLMTEKKKKS